VYSGCVHTDEMLELTKEGDISFFQKEVEASNVSQSHGKWFFRASR